MKVSVKTDYAFRAVEWLAVKFPLSKPTCIEEMARQQRIPRNFLVQILRELKGGGLIRSLRGKQGGYVLARPPDQITVADVFRALEGDVIDVSFAANRFCPEELKQVWARLKNAIEHEAGAITFAEVVAAANGNTAMFEI